MKFPSFLQFLFVLFLSQSVQGQVFMRSFDNAAAMAVGSATVAYPGLGVGLPNEAALGLGERLGLYAGAALPYGIDGWQTAHFQGFARLGAVNGLGLDITHSGTDLYGEQHLRLLYGRKLGSIFYLGGSADLLRVNAQEYGSAQAVTFGLSVLAQALPTVWLGARVFNPLTQDLNGQSLPTVLRIGGAWKPSALFVLLGEMEKDIDRPVQVKGGIEYRPVTAVALRLGVRSDPARIGFGAGFQLKNGLALDAGSEWHSTLGFTPAAMISWRRR